MNLLKHCIKIYLKVLKACWVAFDFSKAFLFWLVFIPPYYAFTHITLLLDNLFFPEYRQVQIKQPIFILAYARSGTTFLHHLLTQSDEYATFKAWEIAFPALTARKLFAPLIAYFKHREQKTSSPTSYGHELFKLDTKEEEEFLFIHWFDTPVLALLTPLVFGNEDYSELCFNDEQLHQKLSVLLFRDCLKRQIYASSSSQIIAKPKNSLMRIKSLLGVFPDAKIIYIQRSPLETIPSALSLHKQLFKKLWGLENISSQRLQKHYQQSFDYCLAYHKYMQALIDSDAISPENLLRIRYQDLRTNLESVLQQIVDFTQLQPSPKLRETWRQACQSNKDYTPAHINESLESFGFSNAQISDAFDGIVHFFAPKGDR